MLGFFPNADLAFGVLGTELWSRAGLGLGAEGATGGSARGRGEFVGDCSSSSRDWLTTTFASERAHGLLAPWVLHTGLGPDAAASGFMTQVIARRGRRRAACRSRAAAARGSSTRSSRLIEDHGGVCETGRDVERVLVADGTATGVRLADGETVARRARGDRERHADAALRAAARRRRAERSPKRGAASATGAPRCRSTSRSPSRRAGRATSGSARTAIVHLTPGARRRLARGQRGRARAAARRGDGRRRPAADDGPSRAPEGDGLLWIQLQELPWHVKGDAAGELDAGDGTWTEELRERYADRIQARLARHIPNLEAAIAQARRALARRPAGGEHQPPARRPLLRLARARPELPLAAVRRRARATRRRSSGSGTSARARTRARASARARARWSRSSCSSRRSTAARVRGLVRVMPLLDLPDHDVAGETFEEDLRAYRAAGVEGIGIWEIKLARRLARAPRRERPRAAAAVPAVPSILPLPLMAGPADPGERIEAICAGIRRWRRSSPSASSSSPGPATTARPSSRAAHDRRRRRERGRARRARADPARVRRSTGRSSTRSTRRPRWSTRPAPDVGIHVRHLARLERAARADRASRRADSSASTSPTGASRRAARPTASCPATASSTSAPILDALRLGRASTTSRSSRDAELAGSRSSAGRPARAGRARRPAAGSGAIERVWVVGAGAIGSLFAGVPRAASATCPSSAGGRSTPERSPSTACACPGGATSPRAPCGRRPGRAARLRPRDRGDEGDGGRSRRRAARRQVARGGVMTVQNGLGAEAIVRGHGAWPMISAVTFMSGTRHADTTSSTSSTPRPGSARTTTRRSTLAAEPAR